MIKRAGFRFLMGGIILAVLAGSAIHAMIREETIRHDTQRYV